MLVDKRVGLALLTATWAIAGRADVMQLDGGVNQIFLLDIGSGINEVFSRATTLNDRGQVAGYFRPSGAETAPWVAFSGSPSSSAYDYGPVTGIRPTATYDRVFLWGLNAPPSTAATRAPVLVGGARLSGSGSALFAFYGVQNSSTGQYTLESIGGWNGQQKRYSESKGVNNAGVAVGYVCSGQADCLNGGSGSPNAFRYDRETGALTEGFAGMNAAASEARAINNAGTIAGAFTPSGANGSHALRYDFASHQGTDLHPYLPSRTDVSLVSSTATAINDAGVGDVAGTATYALNNGQSNGNQQNFAFLVRAGQTQATLLDPADGYQGSAAAGIDSFGAVVGTACARGAGCGAFNETSAGAKLGDNTAMLWINGSKFDLSHITGLTRTGWRELSFADSVERIGDLELISGVGFYDFGGSIGLQRRAFVLRLDASSLPVPEPAAWLLYAAGLVALAGRRLRGLPG